VSEPLKPGFYANIPHARYHDDPCERPSLSSSIASVLVDQSPAHAYLLHPRLGGEPFTPTNEMNHGSLCHELMLKSGREIAIGAWADWRTKDSQAFKEEASDRGAIPTLQHKYDAAQETVTNVTERLRLDFGIELDGHSECVLVWVETADDGTDVLCRAQLDHWRPATAMVYDLKFTEDAHPETCRNKLVPMGYAIQREAYLRGIGRTFPELVGRAEFEFLFCEVAKPYAVCPIQMAGTMREVGEIRWRYAVNLWAKCLRENRWPGYCRRHAEARPWELQASYEVAS
jgi:hypothetical protein